MNNVAGKRHTESKIRLIFPSSGEPAMSAMEFAALATSCSWRLGSSFLPPFDPSPTSLSPGQLFSILTLCVFLQSHILSASLSWCCVGNRHGGRGLTAVVCKRLSGLKEARRVQRWWMIRELTLLCFFLHVDSYSVVFHDPIEGLWFRSCWICEQLFGS